jgi:hypothetical protein
MIIDTDPTAAINRNAIRSRWLRTMELMMINAIDRIIKSVTKFKVACSVDTTRV